MSAVDPGSRVYVYSLWHVRRVGGADDEKLIGIYSTREKALQAKERTVRLKGFRDFPGQFLISRELLDHSSWQDGFDIE